VNSATDSGGSTVYSMALDVAEFMVLCRAVICSQ
jgi:hypothetical protein